MLHSLEGRFSRIPRIVWIGAYLILVTGGLSLLFAGWTYDDPFITYRYADNLSHGLGLIYNPGEHILSTTTALFSLLLALLRHVWADLHGVAVVVGAFSLAVSGLCLWDLANIPGLKLTRWAGLLFFPLFPLADASLSSETPLYLALCLGAFASYQHQRYRQTSLIAALAALTRPDGILVAVILGGHYIWAQRQKANKRRHWLINLPWQALLLYLGIGLAWVLFAWVYYGSPIPVTLFAKQQQATVSGSSAFFPGFLTILSWYSSWPYWVEALLALPGLVYGVLRFPSMRRLAGWTGLYFIAYSMLGVTRYFWYYVPLIPAFVLSFGLSLDGLQSLLTRLRRYYQDKMSVNATGSRLNWTPYLLPWLLLVVVLAGQLSSLWRVHLSPDPRFGIYHAAGEWLGTHSPVDASVGALEVGMIGYYSRRPMVDFAGLIQPDIAVQIGQTGSYAAAAEWAINRYKPDYIVLHQGMFPELEAGVVTQCRLQITLPAAEYDYTHDLNIYTCQ